jgi:hypothetical protein
VNIIDRIDRATGCHTCEKSLGDSVSDLFCSEDCQDRWHEARATPLSLSPDPALVPMALVAWNRTTGATAGSVEEFSGAAMPGTWSIGFDLQGVMVELARVVVPALEHVKAAAESLDTFVQRLQEAGVLKPSAPTEPRARALWLRQHRNTGPARNPHVRLGRRARG